jgi:hypothetical protein
MINLSKKDYIAIEAMKVFLNKSETLFMDDIEYAARMSYLVANEMIKISEAKNVE